MSLNIKEIVQRYGTPTFVYDGKEIINNYNLLANAFGTQTEVFFSLKSNPNISIAKLLRYIGSGMIRYNKLRKLKIGKKEDKVCSLW